MTPGVGATTGAGSLPVTPGPGDPPRLGVTVVALELAGAGCADGDGRWLAAGVTCATWAAPGSGQPSASAATSLALVRLRGWRALGWAATAAWLVPGALAVVVTYTVVTDAWCWPHQSPTNTAPAPVVTANRQAPASDATDALALQEPIVRPRAVSVVWMVVLLMDIRVGANRNLPAAAARPQPGRWSR